MINTQLTAVIPISNYKFNADNLEAILRRASLFGIEVILVLDNQPKSALYALREITKLLKIDAKIVQVNFNNPGSARNSGKRLATRKWVAFWDCDDLPKIEEIIKLIEEAEISHASLAIGNFEIENVRSHSLVIQDLHLKSPQIVTGLNPGVWRMVFLRSALENIDFPDLSMGEDQVFFQRVINKEIDIIFRNYIVYRYRTGIKNQLTSSDNHKKDIIAAHELAVAEYNPYGVFRQIANTMLLRQELTILKYKRSPAKVKLLVAISLLKKTFFNPQIIVQLVIQKLRTSAIWSK